MNQAKPSEAELSSIHGPGIEKLIASGDLDEPVSQGTFLQLSNLIATLKTRREAMGLSLNAVSDRSGLSHPFLVRLENGWNSNPSLDTLFRFAQALDLGVTLGVEEIDPSGEA